MFPKQRRGGGNTFFPKAFSDQNNVTDENLYVLWEENMF